MVVKDAARQSSAELSPFSTVYVDAEIMVEQNSVIDQTRILMRHAGTVSSQAPGGLSKLEILNSKVTLTFRNLFFCATLPAYVCAQQAAKSLDDFHYFISFLL